MSTRKIKDAKDLSTNELIYFKGHAKATYMSDGSTVEDAILMSKNGGSNGITIVNSVDELDANAPAGTVACVATQGAGGVMSFRDLPPFTEANINMDTGTLITEGLSQVTSIALNVGEVNFDSYKQYFIYIVSENVNLDSPGPDDKIAGLIIMGEGSMIQVMGATMDPSTGGESIYALYDSSTGVSQTDLDNFNTYLANNVLYSMIGLEVFMNASDPLTSADFDIIDNIVMAGSGTPSTAEIYIKKDEWEKLYQKDFDTLLNKVDEVRSLTESKSDTIKINDIGVYSYNTEINANVYNKIICGNNGSFIFYLNTPKDNSVYNEYIIEIVCDAYAFSEVLFKDSDYNEIPIKWANDIPPTLASRMTYMISISNGYGVYSMFSN